MTAGYSGTPLPKKLGIKPGRDVLLLGDPLHFDLLSLDTPVGTATPTATGSTVPAGEYEVVLLFCPDAAALVEHFDQAKAAHTTAGAIWVCWPKKSSGVLTDLTEGIVRSFGLANGRVDVKVAAVDATWSALKFVTRLADRVP
jgi:hypothetical protein